MSKEKKSSSSSARRLKRRATEQLHRAKEPFFQVFRKFFDIKLPLPAQALFNKIGSRKNITLFLIYQPNGIDQLTKRTLTQLKVCETDTYVISNGAILKSDAAWLDALGFSYGTRKNIGYDFGGYRDGILWIMTYLQDIERITLINDSSIMPLHGSMLDLYTKLNTLSVDFTGLIEDIETTSNQEKRSRLPSYFWSFNKKAIYSDAFQNFWNDYEPTSSKKLTISRGEWAFNRVIEQTDLTKAAIYDYKDLIRITKNSKKDELEYMLQLLISGKKHLIEKIENLQVSNDALLTMRSELTQLFEDNNHSMLCSLLLIEHLNFPSLKRKALKSHPKARRYFENKFSHLADN